MRCLIRYIGETIKSVMNEEGRASFLKKRSKKLLLIWALGGATPQSQINKSFLRAFF
jgi:hypothetical protein